MKKLVFIIFFLFINIYSALSEEIIPKFFKDNDIAYRYVDPEQAENYGYTGLKTSDKAQFKYIKSLFKNRKNKATIAFIAIQDFIETYEYVDERSITRSKYLPKVMYYLWFLTNFFSGEFYEDSHQFMKFFREFEQLNNINIFTFENLRYDDEYYASRAYKRYLENLYQQIMPTSDSNFRSYYVLSTNEKAQIRKIFCNEFQTTNNWKKDIQNKYSDPKIGKKWGVTISLKNSYESAKCSQLDLKEEIAKKNHEKKQTGFKIDVSNNDDIKDLVDKYEITFDFINFKVEQAIKLKSERNNTVIKRKYEIIEISDQFIFLQESVLDFRKFCDSVGYEDKNDKQLTIFSAVSIGEECVTQTINFDENKKKYALISSTPYLYLKLNLKNNELERRYWPLEEKSLRRKFGKTFSKSILKYEKTNYKVNTKKALEVIFFAASIYLLFNNLNDIKSLAKSSKKGGNISGNTTTSSFASPKSFATSSPQQKYRVLKYFGYIR
jgi:hypothetical protein